MKYSTQVNNIQHDSQENNNNKSLYVSIYSFICKYKVTYAKKRYHLFESQVSTDKY